MGINKILLNLFYKRSKLNTEYEAGEVRVNKDQETSPFLMPKTEKKGLRPISKLFMYGTSLEGIEQLMVMVPNFQPRRSVIVINNYYNCRGGEKDYKICVINVDDGCRDCISDNWYFKINLDNLRYKDLVKECFRKLNNYYLKSNRINLS